LLERLLRRGVNEARAAGWALFRITGDPQPFLSPLDWAASTFRVAINPRRLADLGPHAAAHAITVATWLAERPAYW
jgi:hypothetical protein